MDNIKGNELIITRVFDAPRELVWKAWSEPAQMMKWWGPKGFSAPTINIDFKVGGKFLWCMRGLASPDGTIADYWNTGEYTKIVPMELIVYRDSFADEYGNRVPATHYGMEGFAKVVEVTVTLEEINGKTTMTVRHKGLPEGDMRESCRQGWNSSFDKLAESLK